MVPPCLFHAFPQFPLLLFQSTFVPFDLFRFFYLFIAIYYHFIVSILNSTPCFYPNPRAALLPRPPSFPLSLILYTTSSSANSPRSLISIRSTLPPWRISRTSPRFYSPFSRFRTSSSSAPPFPSVCSSRIRASAFLSEHPMMQSTGEKSAFRVVTGAFSVHGSKDRRGFGKRA